MWPVTSEQWYLCNLFVILNPLLIILNPLLIQLKWIHNCYSKWYHFLFVRKKKTRRWRMVHSTQFWVLVKKVNVKVFQKFNPLINFVKIVPSLDLSLNRWSGSNMPNICKGYQKKRWIIYRKYWSRGKSQLCFFSTLL